MMLPEDDAGLFEEFVHWLYTQHYGMVTTKPKESFEHNAISDKAIRLFVLADKYEVLSLMKEICEMLFRRAREGYRSPSMDVISHAYEALPERSGMRRLICDWCAPSISPSWFQKDSIRDSLLKAPEFAIDLAAALSKRNLKAERDRGLSDYASYAKDL